MLPGKRHGHHGACPKASAGLHIHSGIGLSVIAADDPRGAEGSPRKSRVRIQTHPSIWGDCAGRGAADDCVILGERNGNSVRSGDRQGAFSDELQDFIENKLLQLPNVLAGLSVVPVLTRFALPDLFMKRRKREKRLQRLMSRCVCNTGS